MCHYVCERKFLVGKSAVKTKTLVLWIRLMELVGGNIMEEETTI
jgi:hypothetical protein